MKSTARTLAIVGATALTAAALTACGSGHSKGTAAAAGTTAAPSTGGTPAANAGPTIAETPGKPAANALKAAALKTALLTPADFGTGLAYDVDPDSTDYPATQAVSPKPATTTCEVLLEGGANTDARSWAEATVAAPDGSGLSFVVAGRQYDDGGGKKLLQIVEQKVQGPCATTTTQTTDGQSISHKFTLKSLPGLGDQADLVEDVATSPANGNVPLVFDTLLVRYGDTVITIGDTGTQEQVRGVDLASKAKAYATKLGLH